MSNPTQTARRLPRLRPLSQIGATMIEAMMAMAVIALFLAGEYAANARVWSLVRASLESNAASRVLNGRAEQLRASTWDQITSNTFITGSILSVAPDVGGDLGGLVETIYITAYPTPSPEPAPVRITRSNTSGAVTVISAGDGTMNAQSSIRIDLTASWTAKGGAARLRQISMIVGNGGITGRH